MRYKDVCMRNNNAVNSDTMYWLGRLADCTKWKSTLNQHLKTGEARPSTAAADNRTRSEEHSISSKPDTTHIHVCDICDKDCNSPIVLFSYKQRCLIRATS